ncbi:hypothetical protein [Dactylosporangium sp. NPDC005555]
MWDRARAEGRAQLSLPWNHFESSNGTPTVTANPPPTSRLEHR